MNTSEYNYRLVLEDEFESRKKRNPGYSLRAFARDLDVPVSKLSEVMRGMCGLSAQSALKLSEKLHLTDNESKRFVLAVEVLHSRSKKNKLSAQKRLDELKLTPQFDEISLERFKIISDWYHFAILELTEVENFESSFDWIAKRLNIDILVVQKAIERLIDFGLLVEANGVWKQTQADLATPSGIPSREIRNHHSQILIKAQTALETTTVRERDFSSMTMAFDDDQLDEAKLLIKDFRRKFDKLMKETSNSKKRVYTLAIQYFPLDIPEVTTSQEISQ